METELSVIIRYDTVTIREAGADAVTYPISENSLESMAWDIGRAVSDYLEGL